MARPEKGHGDLKGDLEPDLGPDLEKPEGVVREDDGAAQKKDGSRVRFSEEAKIIHHHEQSNGNDGPTSAEDADNQTSTGRRVRFVGEAVIEEDEVKGPPDEDPSEQAGDVEDDEAEGEDGGAQDDDEYVDEEDDFEEDDEDAEEDGVDVEALGSITDVLPNQGALLELLKSGKAGKNELIEAARRGDLDTVESLLTDAKWIEAINDVDIFDYTALHFACEEGHLAIVTSLLAAHADIECATKMHFSRPLHYAAFNGHRNVVLAKAGADLEARTDDGRTALFQASFNGHHSIVEALLDLEANHLAKDLEGRLPLDVAENEETRKVLRAAGVKGLMEEQKEGTQAEPRIGSKRKSG